MPEENNTSKVKKEIFPQDLSAQLAALNESAQMKEYRRLRTQATDCPWNPIFHFYAPDGRINDPNGLCFWRGNYHLFYQAYPPADPRQHWGHAYSVDMVHWIDLPLAIYPDKEEAAYSGATCVEENRVIAMYHGRGAGSMIATSSDPLLLNWEKEETNPVIPIPPNQLESGGKPYDVFDPFIWKEETGYYALSGTFYGDMRKRGRSDQNRMVEHLFYSQDLKCWDYRGEFAPDGFPQIPLGNDGACPYFLPLGERYVLFSFSHWSGAYATIGDYDRSTHHFTPQRTHQFNHGPVGCSSYQAPSAMPDGKGGVYFILNTKDSYHGMARYGMMSLMYHMSLDEEGEMRITPVKSIDMLHGGKYEKDEILLPPFQEVVLEKEGKAVDIHCRFDGGSARAIRLRVFRSRNAEEYTDIVVHLEGARYRGLGYLTIDTINGSLSKEVLSRIPESTAFQLKENEQIDLRILLDHCILEVFVNDRAVLMQHVYPTLNDSAGISITAIGGEAMLRHISVWDMNSIYT